MASICWNPFPMRMFEADGDFASGAKAYFYAAGTTTPLVVHNDSFLTSPATWPVIADSYGLFAPVYIGKGNPYKVIVLDSNDNTLYTADGVSNPVENEGAGLVVSAPMIHQTGDMIWNAGGSDRIGWVRANGTSISNPAGSGSQLKSDTAAALFSYLWNGFPDSICPVTGGRGASATLDFGIGKGIATLDMRGRAQFGLEETASVFSVPMNITTTNGSPTATVAQNTAPYSIDFAARYCYVSCANVPAGTIITERVGSTVTLSANATVTGTIVCKISAFPTGGVTPGDAGGLAWFANTASEMPTHGHGVGVTVASSTPTGAGQTQVYHNSNGGTLAVSSSATVRDGTADTGHSHNVYNSSAAFPGSFVVRETSANGATFDLTAAGTTDSTTGTAFTDLQKANIGVTVSNTWSGQLVAFTQVQVGAITSTPTVTQSNAGNGNFVFRQPASRIGTYWLKL